MSNVVSQLIDSIGIRLTTYIANESDARKVKSWAEGSVVPDIDQIEILVVTKMIMEEFSSRESEELGRTFLTGNMDVGTENIAPAEALRRGLINEVMAHKNRVLNGEWS